MKKLKLSELNLGGVEVLTREQLKKVLGGDGSGGSGGDDCCMTTDCTGKERCFYSGPEGCGYVTCQFRIGGSGDCYGTLQIISPQPCGWA